MENCMWNWLADRYDEGSLTDAEIGDALSNPYRACLMFEDCFLSDKYSTGQMVQEELERFKKHLALRAKRKNANKIPQLG